MNYLIFPDFQVYLPRAMILHFSRRGGYISDELNVIFLATDWSGRYRATGISSYDNGDGTPQWYSLGDDLEIKLMPSADGAIRQLPSRLAAQDN